MVEEDVGERPRPWEQAWAFPFSPPLRLTRSCGDGKQQPTIGYPLQVLVRDNNVDQALRVLKKKMQREGVFREMKLRKAYEKPSERKARERADAVRRARKLARKQAIREGLIAAPKPKPRFATPRPGVPPRPAI
jgi:small subunit ribosomal protein S21